jgi:hypothetical protein
LLTREFERKLFDQYKLYVIYILKQKRRSESAQQLLSDIELNKSSFDQINLSLKELFIDEEYILHAIIEKYMLIERFLK